MGFESTFNRLEFYAKNQLFLDKLKSQDDLVAAIDRVSAGNVQKAAEIVMAGEKALAVVGQVQEAEIYKGFLL